MGTLFRRYFCAIWQVIYIINTTSILSLKEYIFYDYYYEHVVTHLYIYNKTCYTYSDQPFPEA